MPGAGKAPPRLVVEVRLGAEPLGFLAVLDDVVPERPRDGEEAVQVVVVVEQMPNLEKHRERVYVYQTCWTRYLLEFIFSIRH